ncbi:MAG: DUF1559 domain-containing protein [Planctomycetota bacterium]
MKNNLTILAALVTLSMFVAYGQDTAEIPTPATNTDSVKSQDAERKLRQIMLGLLNYESAMRAFPPRYSVSRDGKSTLLSWRVHILPFLDEEELYQKFKLDEPWNSEHNRKLISEIPAIYQSGGVKAKGLTRFLSFEDDYAPLGPPVFPVGTTNPRGYGIRDCKSGTSFTIAVIRADTGEAVPWTQPSDLKVPDVSKLLTEPNADLETERLKAALFGKGNNNRLAVMADGSIKRITPKDIFHGIGSLTCFVQPDSRIAELTKGVVVQMHKRLNSLQPANPYGQLPNNATPLDSFSQPSSTSIRRPSEWSQQGNIQAFTPSPFARLSNEALKTADEKQREAKLAELEKVLEQSFDEVVNRQRQQLVQLEKQVAKIRATLEHREKNRERLIKNYVDRIRLQAEGLTIPAINQPLPTPELAPASSPPTLPLDFEPSPTR